MNCARWIWMGTALLITACQQEVTPMAEYLEEPVVHSNARIMVADWREGKGVLRRDGEEYAAFLQQGYPQSGKADMDVAGESVHVEEDKLGDYPEGRYYLAGAGKDTRTGEQLYVRRRLHREGALLYFYNESDPMLEVFNCRGRAECKDNCGFVFEGGSGKFIGCKCDSSNKSCRTAQRVYGVKR